MHLWHRLSFKLIGSVAIVSLVMSGATFLWQSYQQRRSAEATLLEKAEAVSMQFLAVRSYVAQSGRGSPEAPLPGTFRHLEPEAVARVTGQIFGDVAHTQVREVWTQASDPSHHPDGFETEALASFTASTPAPLGTPHASPAYWRMVPADDGDRFRYVQPIYMEESCLSCHAGMAGPDGQAYTGKLMGALSISVPAAPYQESLASRLRSHLIFSSTLFLATLLALLVLLGRLVTRPLQLLTERAGRIGAGDLAPRPTLPSRDEIGLLSHTMEAMAAQLKSLYDSLEARVEERTRRLREMNEALRRQSQELEEKGRELARANRLKSEFLASVSHELRTPLSSILAFTELMLDEREGLSFEQREYLQEIQQSSQRLYGQITDLLDMARIEAGMMRLELEALQVGPLLASAVRRIRPLAEQKGITLNLETPDADPVVEADGEKLMQVLGNLLSNAVKFTPRGGRVTVGVAPAAPGRLRFWVRDTGVGIPAEHLERIFEKFHQVEEPGTRKPPGSGLGLTLARNLISLHGGRIWAESEPGEGSTFSFELPAWSGGAPPEGERGSVRGGG
ncbi:ATP-binding protein [Limnochorda pilosa]|uniref:Circadian input-output histidine kinase CikA n=1 Tax=Limnochorda pilosa TaxID=1555112 RepID=A0A0K2SIZ8_LIMPI|nr:ATP-binding protein [Limnochorda pilosa]BAS27065.1 histidine kinase [Limnochorda pilosa]